MKNILLTIVKTLKGEDISTEITMEHIISGIYFIKIEDNAINNSIYQGEFLKID